MRKALLIGMTLLLSACANLRQALPDERFEAYREEVRMQREAGKISALNEQEKLRDRYWQIYGKDPDSTGHFAFSMSLIHSAEIGNFPMNEARALVAAREKDLFFRQTFLRQVAAVYEFSRD